MTVSHEQVRVSYVGDGISTNFAIPFPFYLTTDITVMLGTVVQSSGYSITGGEDANGNPQPGTAVFSSAPPATVAVQLILDVPLTQLVNLVDGTEFPSSTLNQVNDRAIQALLRHDDLLSRTIAAPDGDLSPNLSLPIAASRANTYLTFDSNGNLSVAQSVPSGTLSQASIGFFLQPQTEAEAAAGIVPTNFAYPTWDVRRLGVIGDGVTDDTVALQRVYTVGGDWNIPTYMRVLSTNTITGRVATRLYSDSAGGIGLGTLSSNLPQAYLIHDFNGAFFDLVGSSSSNLVSAGFSFERLTFVQKNGNGTGSSGSCIRSVQVSTTQRCTWIRLTDVNFETLSGSVNDWTHNIELDGTVLSNPNNLRDVFLTRVRCVSGANATDSISLKGVANVFLTGVETNLSKGDLNITGSGGNSSTSIFINGCTFNNINMDLATNVYGDGNSAATVTSTVNTLNVKLGCSCSGSPPTIAGTRVYVHGLHATGKDTVSGNNNFRFEIGANTLETSGPISSGTNPAGAGDVRLPNNGPGVVARNAANTGDISIASVNSANAVALGNPGSAMGFYGTAGLAKQVLTGGKGGNSALANLIALLASLGLLTDNTT